MTAVTWKELFRVDQRYAAKCCGGDGPNPWLNRIFDDCQNYKLTPAQMLNAEIASAEALPWHDANFLKKSFLEGCDRAGLFD